MSTLDESLQRVESSLSRLVTALEGGECTGAQIDSLTKCYGAAEAELEAALAGRTSLPSDSQAVVQRIVGLHGVAKHALAGEMKVTSTSLEKVRGSRKALGVQGNSDYVGMGATAVDCDMQG